MPKNKSVGSLKYSHKPSGFQSQEQSHEYCTEEKNPNQSNNKLFNNKSFLETGTIAFRRKDKAFISDTPKPHKLPSVFNEIEEKLTSLSRYKT